MAFNKIRSSWRCRGSPSSEKVGMITFVLAMEGNKVHPITYNITVVSGIQRQYHSL
jgi:hypothetical protein